MPRRLANCRDITQLPVTSEIALNKKNSLQTRHILGAGSIGNLFAAHMQANGENCCLLLKNQQLAAWKKHSYLTIHYKNQCYQQTLHSEAIDASTPIRWLLITTKAQHTMAALHSIANRLTADATICLLQNGMGIAEKILEEFPHIQLLQASTSE